jgi:hypothetical protein
MALKDSVNFPNLASFDDDPDWLTRRYPVTGAIAITALFIGALVKFDATRANVQGAVAADDAVLEGVICDLPDNTDVPIGAAVKTVAVALNGSFDKNTVKYADGTTPISAAGIARLRAMGIFIDAATPAGPFGP